MKLNYFAQYYLHLNLLYFRHPFQLSLTQIAIVALMSRFIEIYSLHSTASQMLIVLFGRRKCEVVCFKVIQIISFLVIECF